MSTIASLVATLGLDSSGFQKGIKDAEGSAGGLSGSLSKIGMVSFAAATAGVAAIGGAAIKSTIDFAKFDGQMNEVFTLMPGMTQSAMSEMTGSVKGFSKEFGVLPNEVVPALYQSISAGVPSDNVFEFLETAQKAAKGGVTDLTTAVDGISSVVNAYGSEMIDATSASDLMFTAVKLGKTDFSQLSASLFNVVPTAASLGVGFEEITASMARMTSMGTPTSVATTQLRSLFVEASKSGTGLSDAIHEVAGKSFAELISEGKNTGQILDLVRDSMPEQEFKDMFGSVEAMNAALAISGPNGEAFASALDEMKNSAGATDTAFRTMDQGLGPMWDRMKAGVAVAALDFGAKLEPAIVKVGTLLMDNLPAAIAFVSGAFQSGMAAIQPWLDKVMEIGSTVMDTVLPPLQQFADWFTGNSDAMSAAGAAIGGILVAAFVGLSIAAGAAAVSMVAAALPFVAIIAVAAALGAGIYLLIKNWDDITAKFPLAGTALEGVKNIWAGVLGWVTGEFLPGIMGIADAVMAAGSAALGFVQGHWDSIVAIISAAAALIGTQVKIHFELLGDIISGALEIVTGIINVFVGVLTGDWQRAWDGIKSIASGVWTILTGIIQAGIATIQNIITNGGSLMSAAFGMAMDILKGLASTAWEGIKGAVQAGVDALPGLISAAGGALSSAAQAAWDAVKGAVSTAWDAIKGFVSDGVAALPGLVTAGAGLLMDAGTAILTALWDGAKAVWAAVVSWVPTLPGIAADIIKGGAGMLLSAGETILTAMWDGAKTIFGNLIGWADTLGDLIRAAVVAGVAWLLEAGQKLMEELWKGLKQIWMDVIGWFGELPGKIVAAIGNAGSILKDTGAQVISGFIEGIKSKFGDVQGALGELTGKLTGWKGPESVDKVLLFENGQMIIDGFIDGLEAKYDAAKSSLTDFTADLQYVAEKEWVDINAQMKTIGDTAATEGGKSFANRWMTSLQAGIDAGMVSVKTAVATMKGVIATVNDAFAGSAMYLAESRGGWQTLIDQRNALLLQEDPNGPISATFHGAQNESTIGIGGANGYWDTLSQTQQASMTRRTSDIWVPSPEDVEGFAGSGKTENHYHISGYIQGEDDLLRVLNKKAVESGAQPLLVTP